MYSRELLCDPAFKVEGQWSIGKNPLSIIFARNVDMRTHHMTAFAEG